MTSKLSTALRRVLAQNPGLLTPEQALALLKAVEIESREPDRTTALATAKTREELLAAEAAWWA